jgi:hypothetical protein
VKGWTNYDEKDNLILKCLDHILLGEMGGVLGIVDMNTSSFDEISKHQY